jgi:type III pantothenate kinase
MSQNPDLTGTLPSPLKDSHSYRRKRLTQSCPMSAKSGPDSESWIALAVGNSRLHWALFSNDSLQHTCDTLPPDPERFLASPQDWSAWQSLCPFFPQMHPFPELWAVSVVPRQTQLWQHYPRATLLERSDIPLQGMYPTLGLDRALALWSAGTTYGWPILIVDSGTALTFTGADATGVLVGGAIAPGLGLKLRSLQAGTAGLPLATLPSHLPELWATDTEKALQSGAVYEAISNLIFRTGQWLNAYPGSPIILTGGDTDLLDNYLQLWHRQISPLEWLDRLQTVPHLMLQGIAALRSQKDTIPPSKSKINPKVV